ncbi:MAG: hypothetical protein PHT59_04940 [Candidatus Omnitrophica bacterium]|nr:hypothetical protein [Candidatus Omnitrophota bacterium]
MMFLLGTSLLVLATAVMQANAYAICLSRDPCDCNRSSKKYGEFYERLRAHDRQEALFVLEGCLENCWSTKALHEDAAILNLARHDPEAAMPRIERALSSNSARKTDPSFDYFLQELAYLQKEEPESAQVSFANAVEAARKAGQKNITFNTYRIDLDLAAGLDTKSLDTIVPALEDAIAPPEAGVSWALRLMYLAGVSVTGAIALAALALVYRMLPIHGRAVTCPVERLAAAAEVVLDVGRADTVVLERGTPAFTEIIGNLTDEKNLRATITHSIPCRCASAHGPMSSRCPQTAGTSGTSRATHGACATPCRSPRASWRWRPRNGETLPPGTHEPVFYGHSFVCPACSGVFPLRSIPQEIFLP